MELVAFSDKMQEVLRLVTKVAPTDANVLITGESGVGKDALARLIHSRSERSGENFVKIDCSVLPGELLEAELFGYEKGAFTGASARKPGRLEAAHKGTLILDEIAHLGVDAQAKLLRVIEKREFERLGGNQTIKVDARLIALTNVDLRASVERRAFREDLFYRLNVVHIEIPPLRERRRDIAPLAKHFLSSYAEKHGRQVKNFSPEVLQLFEEYDFPGNIRELAHAIERAVIVSQREIVNILDLPEVLRISLTLHRKRNRRLTLAELEAEYITDTLSATGGNKSEAARLLGISRKNLYEKIARYHLEV
jgi:DNA-binding NtrC family response regulator